MTFIVSLWKSILKYPPDGAGGIVLTIYNVSAFTRGNTLIEIEFLIWRSIGLYINLVFYVFFVHILPQSRSKAFYCNCGSRTMRDYAKFC